MTWKFNKFKNVIYEIILKYNLKSNIYHSLKPENQAINLIVDKSKMNQSLKSN